MRTITPLCDGWFFAIGNHDAPPTDSAFVPVCLPHDWAIANPVNPDAPLSMSQGYFNRREIGWYKRALDFAPEYDEVVRLCFGGVYENCTVWVNGTEAGSQRYGYTPFELDIGQLLHPGRNELLVRVDNTAEPADRWYSGCGIYRTVSLLRMNTRHLDEKSIQIITSFAQDTARVQITTGTADTLYASLTSPSGQTYTASGCRQVTLTVPQAERWSSEHPARYLLTLSLVEGEQTMDEVSFPIGLRSVTFGANGLFVNGEPVKLRGVCLHQDFACVGIAVRPELWRERLMLLKKMGCNAIRAAHHLYASEFLDLCDELGFYVYEECFDKWHSGLYGRYFDADWQHDLDAMILRDRNRPSVIIWGVGNEVENQALPSMLSTLQMLVARAHALDSTRPVTCAMNPHFKRRSNIDPSTVKDIQAFVDEVDEREIEDLEERVACISRIAQCVDIISCNYQEQWYDAIRRANPGKPILGTEVYQYFMGHAENMQNYVERIPSLVPPQWEDVIGSFIWTGFDYLGESMGWPSKGWTGSIFRTNHVPRFSYYVLKSHWVKEPMVRIGILDYTLPDEYTKESWAMPPYEELWDYPQIRKAVLPIMVATNCERVIVQYGEKKLILDSASRDANGMLRGFIPYVPGKLIATGYIGETPVCEHVLETPGPAAKLVFESKKPTPRGEQVLYTVQAQDSEGRFILRAEQTVHFAVEGAGEIVAVDNGDLTCPLPYRSHDVPLFRGRASVLVRTWGDQPVCVTASSEGLESARIRL